MHLLQHSTIRQIHYRFSYQNFKMHKAGKYHSKAHTIGYMRFSIVPLRVRAPRVRISGLTSCIH